MTRQPVDHPGVQAGLAMRSIAAFASEEHKQRWLPRMFKDTGKVLASTRPLRSRVEARRGDQPADESLSLCRRLITKQRSAKRACGISSQVRLPDSLGRQGTRIFGPPPPQDAPKLAGWTYVRQIYVRLLPFAVPLWIAFAFAGSAWLLILLGFSVATWLVGFTSVSWHIRRLRSAPPEP